jgi:hypothetical protein
VAQRSKRVSAAKYQIFVSSTYEDLKDERDQVRKAILEIGHIPVGMEMFSAADEEQWAVIKRHIDESDYYVVIVANRYGSVTDEGLSFTEKEYDYAVEQGVPTIAFVLDPAAPWRLDRGESEAKSQEALESFKTKLKQKPIKKWRSKDDLAGSVAIAITKLTVARPRPGWVRGSEAAGANVLKEISRLSEENSALRKELAGVPGAENDRKRQQAAIRTVLVESLNAARLALSGAENLPIGIGGYMPAFPAGKYFRDSAWTKNAETLAEILHVSVLEHLSWTFDFAKRVFGEASETTKYDATNLKKKFAHIVKNFLEAMELAVESLPEDEMDDFKQIIEEVQDEYEPMAAALGLKE